MKLRLITFLIIILFTLIVSGCTNIVSNESGESIKIDASTLTSEAQFFEHDVNGVAVKYFAVLDSNGESKVAYDACDVCGGSKGYHQEGNYMVCNNCGQRFLIDGLGTENKGYGCWPSYLESETVGGEIIIKESTLKTGVKRFI